MSSALAPGIDVMRATPPMCLDSSRPLIRDPWLSVTIAVVSFFAVAEEADGAEGGVAEAVAVGDDAFIGVGLKTVLLFSTCFSVITTWGRLDFSP